MSRKGILGAFLALTVGLMTQMPALAKQLDLLQSIPLEISGYEFSKTIPARLATADEVMAILTGTDNLLIHMEVIRRARFELPASEQAKLITALHSRHRADANEPYKFFDHGYAMLVITESKNGLFFLRKADDKLQNQFTALAYGMAQAETDLNDEGSTPDVMTKRKMDARYSLRDAVNRDAAHHMPGFWPSYVKVLEKLEPMATYNNFVTSDLSRTYVPDGNSVIPMRGSSVSYIPMHASDQVLTAYAQHTSCNPDTVTDVPRNAAPAETGKPVASRTADFNGQNARIEFYKSTEEPGKYRVRVLSQDGFPLLAFSTYRVSSLVEDLEGDGTYEIVVRQYEQDRKQPVIVYRATPCGFELDKQVFSYFR